MWSLVACGAALLAYGCVPSSQYLEMRSKYEEEAAKNRRLVEENQRLRDQLGKAGSDAEAARIREELARKEAELAGQRGIWDRFPSDVAFLEDGGRKLTLGELTFASGKADLTPKGRAALDQVANQLKRKAGVLLIVDGHTDTDPIRRSDNKSNWELSGKRSAAVADYLVKSGAIKGGNVIIRGFSQFRPADPGNKAKNRRVELFYIPLDKSGAPAAGGRGPGGDATLK
jgi:chemotaxis protein MotB